MTVAYLEAILADLKETPLLGEGFPRRPRHTVAEWWGLSEEARRDALSVVDRAIRELPDWQELEELVRDLGRSGFAPAVPVLSRLWNDCPIGPVRRAAGHALFAIGTAESRAALEALLLDHEHLSGFLAVRAIFDGDPPGAFDRLAPWFDPERITTPDGATVASIVLGLFCPSSYRYTPEGTQPGWIEARAPGWLKDDARWVELCVRLRRDPTVGPVARKVLRYAEAAQVHAALEEVRRREGPRVVPVRSAGGGDLLARYRRGEHEAVWRELRAAAAIAGDFRAEALAVAEETMRRVAHDADLLAERLAARGWVALTGELRVPPGPEDLAAIEQIEDVSGAPLPPSVRAFFAVVGGVDLVFSYRDGSAVPPLGVELPMHEMDPLCVAPARACTYLFDEWEEKRSPIDPELDDPFPLDLAPDYLHKADISGGPPYCVELPDRSADPPFAYEEHALPFVDYLRLCFRWGGFSRLDRHGTRDDVRRFVAEMTRGLEPF